MNLNHRDEDDGAKTSFMDVSEVLKIALEEVERQKTAQSQKIKAAILPLIHENEELRRLDLEALDNAHRLNELRQRTEEVVRFELKRLDYDGPGVDRDLIVKEILDEALGLGPLEPLLDEPGVDEIMVNGPDRIFVERRGKVELTDRKFASNQQVYNIIERIVAPVGRRIDESSPSVDARLVRDGSRVHIIIPPLALNGPTITIRKFKKTPYTQDDLMKWKSISRQACDFLDVCVKAKKSIIVSGGTGTGKTTLLNILSQAIPEDERVITIEDAAELRLSKLNLVSLESRRSNMEGKGEITIRELVRNALRMRPDRIIVGECRGAEAFDMLQAMNTGHEGSLTTIHANTPTDMLTRLENLVLMAAEIPVSVIRQNIASAVSLVVQISRFRDGTRKISYITEVMGVKEGQIQTRDLYVFRPEGLDAKGKVLGSLRSTGCKPTFLEDMRANGFILDESLFIDRTENDTPPAQVSTSGVIPVPVTGGGRMPIPTAIEGGGVKEERPATRDKADGLFARTVTIHRNDNSH